MKYLILLSLISCTGVPNHSKVLTNLQKEWLINLDLSSKVYMEDCLSYRFATFSECFNKYNKSKLDNKTKPTMKVEFL